MPRRGLQSLATALVIPIILSSCSPGPAPVPPATSTPVAATATLATSTITPTPKPTGTPTPQGATDFDLSNGQYTKVENGKTYYWVPIQINAADKSAGHWFESRMVGGKSIPLIDSSANLFGGSETMIPFRLYFIEGLQQLSGEGYLYHPDGAAFYESQTKYYSIGDLRLCSFTTAFEWELLKRQQGSAFKPEEVPQLLKSVQAGTLVFPFNVASDTTAKKDAAARIEYAWNVRRGYDVFMVNWADADPALDPTFAESEVGTWKARWKVVAWHDKLVLITASSAPDKMKDFELLTQVLAGLGAVIKGEAVPSGRYAVYESLSYLSVGPRQILAQGSCSRPSGVSIPLLPHVQVLSSNATPTPPPSPTAARAASVEQLFPGATITATETFDDAGVTGWWLDPKQTSLTDGVLRVDAKDWGGAMFQTNLLQGSGALINFRYDTGANFQLVLDTGDWNTAPYKSFAVHVQDGEIRLESWQGREQLVGEAITGKLIVKPNTWYSALLEIGKDGEFTARIWAVNDPGKTAQYQHSFNPVWSTLPWTFRIGSGQGPVFFDNFQQVSFESK